MANNGTTFRPEFWTDPRPVSAPLRNQSEVKRKESYNKLFGVGQNPLSCSGLTDISVEIERHEISICRRQTPSCASPIYL